MEELQHIDIAVGLKYLNNNQALYLKILNNFFDRYHDLNFDLLSVDELKDVIHTIKGLSATLGMSALAKATKELDRQETTEYRDAVKFELAQVLSELRVLFAEEEQLQTILIVNDKVEEIDQLVTTLEGYYDLLVALDGEEAKELMGIESIDLVLLGLDSQGMNGETDLQMYIQQQNIPILLSSKKISKREEVTVAMVEKLLML